MRPCDGCRSGKAENAFSGLPSEAGRPPCAIEDASENPELGDRLARINKDGALSRPLDFEPKILKRAHLRSQVSITQRSQPVFVSLTKTVCAVSVI